MRRFLKKVLENGREEKRGVVYGWYTGGIRGIYGGIRRYTEVYGGIRRYTGYIVSIALIKVYGGIRKYTEVYGSIR